MQIHFIWINDFGFFKETGINLSAQFFIELLPLPDTSNKKKVLRIRNNPDYIHDFFEKSNVSNVTAIIGKNGSGKSSILKYISSNLPQGLEANIENDLFVYSSRNGAEEQFNIIAPEHLQFELNDKTGLFKQQLYGEENNFRFSSQLSNAEYIYYSYFLEYNTPVTNFHGLRNISTAAIMSDERRRIFEENRNSQISSKLLMEAGDLERLTLNEMAKAIQFFNSVESKNLPFNKPKYLSITINLLDLLHFSEDPSKNEDVLIVLNQLVKSNQEVAAGDRLMNNLFIALLINFLIDERKYSVNNLYLHPLQEFNNNVSIKDYVLGYFASMRGAHFYREGTRVDVPKLDRLSYLVPQFIDFIEEMLKDKQLVPLRGDSYNTMRLSLNQDTEEAFDKFRALYLSVKGISTFFDFNWRELSTGEQSYLSLMARFYHVKHHEHNSLPANLVILIDEGDAGYHPAWQRTFFNTTLNYLSDLFDGHQLQLIFTANAPFLTSDLPKSHVLFIKQMEDKTVIVNSKDNNRQETFAANIHTLFSDSFYMEGALMGEFAKMRLQKIIDFINDDNPNLVVNESYKKTIDIVGEPVLRKKLQGMWFERFGLTEEKAQLLKRLEEIDKIQAAKNKTEDD